MTIAHRAKAALILAVTAISGMTCGAARAETPAPFPAALGGNWAMPECGERTSVALVFSKYFSLIGHGDRYLIRGAPAIEMRGEVMHLAYSERPYDVKPDGPDRILYHDETLAALGGKDMSDPFVQPQYRYLLMKFARCDALPGLNAEGMDAFRQLDDVAQACAGTAAADNPACRRAGVAAFDADDSGALDAKELAMAYHQTHFLVAGTTCSVRFPGDSAEAAPAFAAAALNIADTDGSAALALHEIEENWTALAATESVVKYTKLLRLMSALIPALPAPAEPPPPCACDVPPAAAAASSPESAAPLPQH